jgi:hypothetical protein
VVYLLLVFTEGARNLSLGVVPWIQLIAAGTREWVKALISGYWAKYFCASIIEPSLLLHHPQVKLQTE